MDKIKQVFHAKIKKNKKNNDPIWEIFKEKKQ